jgi:hypothetical protein
VKSLAIVAVVVGKEWFRALSCCPPYISSVGSEGSGFGLEFAWYLSENCLLFATICIHVD